MRDMRVKPLLCHCFPHEFLQMRYGCLPEVTPTIAIACWSVVEKRSKARCLASAIALMSEVIMPEVSTAIAMSWSVTGRISPSQ